MKLDAQTLGDLVDERLPRGQVRAIQSAFKDPGRFDAYVELLQSRVPWDDPIVLPFGEHLFIVAKGAGEYVVKCDCGHEGPTVGYDIARYPSKMHGDPAWNHLREYYCPGCKAQLEVEAVPHGYPVIHDFVPDLEGFYEEWLGRPLPGGAA